MEGVVVQREESRLYRDRKRVDRRPGRYSSLQPTGRGASTA